MRFTSLHHSLWIDENIIRNIIVGVVAQLVVFVAGCGGGNYPPVPGNTSVTLLASSSANDRLSIYSLAPIQTVTLVSDSGATASLLSPVGDEFIHRNGTVEPLSTVSVPQGTYTSATVTVGSSTFMCEGLAPDGNENFASFMDGQTSNVTVNLPSPVTITGAAMGLVLDLQVSQSASWSPGSCSGNAPGLSPYSITPTFSLTPVTFSAQPTNVTNGMAVNLIGLIGTIDANGTGFSVTTPSISGVEMVSHGPTWDVTTNSNTAYQGVTDSSQLTAGMPVDMDGAIQANGSLLATRIAVYDANPTNLSLWSGPLTRVWNSQEAGRIDVTDVLEEGPLMGSLGSAPFNDASVVFQVSGQIANLQNLPFPAVFSKANMVAGQNIFLTTHAVSGGTAPSYTPASTITLVPQTINGTVSAIGSSGSFTTYTVTLAPYDIFSQFAVQQDQTTLLTNPSQVVVYADSNTQMLNTNPIAVGSVVRFYGLVFNDSGTLRMDCSQINDGVAE